MTEKNYQGRAHKFGDDINTDYMLPARRMYTSLDMKDLAKYLMEDVDPDFMNRVKQGDFIVAGENFGCGSAREQAVRIIPLAGISVVLAKSYSRLFFRNAINLGVIAIECNTDLIEDGDLLFIDLPNNKVINKTQNREIEIIPLSGLPLEIINSGGLVNYFKAKAYI